MKTWTKGIVTGLLAGVVILGSLPAVAGPYDSEHQPAGNGLRNAGYTRACTRAG